jgi:hypothetical protein
VDVGKQRQAGRVADFRQDLQALFQPGTAEGLDRGAVGLVERGLVDDPRAGFLGDGADPLSDRDGMIARFDDARAGEEEGRSPSADRECRRDLD